MTCGRTRGILNDYATGGGSNLLLDDYPNVYAGFSLRDIKDGNTNVIRVRRSSDDAESDFTATEVTDGTLTTWTGANDGFVVTWYDQSGNTHDASQSTAANQPRIVNSGTLETDNEGNAAIYFDGSNDALSLDNYSASDFNDTHEMYTLVFSIPDAGQFKRIFFRASSTAGGSAFSGQENNSSYRTWVNGSSTFSSTGIAVDDTIIGTWESDDSGNFELWINGVSDDTDSGTKIESTYALWSLAGKQGGVGNVEIYMSEVVLWDHDYTGSLSSIESDMSGHWTIT